jgi:sugar/nucleoside kinase (ribokinase family)
VTVAAIEVLHIGSASRDITDADPRGWRLGGGAPYSALTTARLGLRTAALVGVDAPAADAGELDLLREAGVELLTVPLAEGPIFRNDERPEGRIQTCVAPGEPLPVVDLPAGWATVGAWSLVPVAGEVEDAWASAVPSGTHLSVAWQGLLRELAAGRVVGHRPPAASPLIRRADLVGVSRHDLVPGTAPSDLGRLLGVGASLLVTEGAAGGQLLRTDRAGRVEALRYEALAADREDDPTGAGDTFLAALLASIVRPAIVPGAQPGRGPNQALGPNPVSGPSLAFAAAAASLVVERPGLLGVPDLAAVQARYAERGHRRLDGGGG